MAGTIDFPIVIDESESPTSSPIKISVRASDYR